MPDPKRPLEIEKWRRLFEARRDDELRECLASAISLRSGDAREGWARLFLGAIEASATRARIAAREIDTPPSIARDRLERFRLSLPVEQVRRCSRRPQHTVRGIRRGKHDQAIRAGIGQRPGKHRVTDAEDRRVCPHANGEAQHGDDC